MPDIAAWRRDRMASLPEKAWFELHPDWVCEVLSVSTEELDRTKKLPLYALAGIPHLWLVDPVSKQFEIYRRNGSDWALLSVLTGRGMVSAEPFDAIAIELGRLWE